MMNFSYRAIAIVLTCCSILSPSFAQTNHTEQLAEAELANPNNKNLLSEPIGLPFSKSYTITGDPKNLSKKVKHQPALKELDGFIKKCIYQGVFPGCQIFAAKDGEIIFQKNYGYFTYDRKIPVTDSTLYDIASITKIAATTLAVMKLYDQDKLDLSAPLKKYLPFTQGTDKANMTIANLLMHQAGLKAWIPFYRNTLDSISGVPRQDLYREISDSKFNLAVAPKIYLNASYLQTIWDEILMSEVERKQRYVYSDLDFYFLKLVVEVVSGLPLDQFVNNEFYEPLGLNNTLYNPWKKGWVQRCAPTEDDKVFRYQLVQGYVHDQGAALLGGVAGHAGLFANVSDLAVLLQMLNNGGVYENKRYLKRKTVASFTRYHSTLSRRGYGFDKPDKEKGEGGPASKWCSKMTFGHQGFTGTCAWADPETGITFIFLSNRVHPSAENRLINRMDVRTTAQSYIYEALGYAK